MEIKNVIKDDIYKKFIDYAYNKDLILRVTLSNFGLDEKKLETLNLTINKLLNIDPASLIKIVTYDKTMILPSIEIQKMYYLNHPKVDVWQKHYYFHFSLKLKEYLLSITNIYGRKKPQFPEDICFIKDGYYWFESYSIDEESYVYCENIEEYEYLKFIGLEFYGDFDLNEKKLECNEIDD